MRSSAERIQEILYSCESREELAVRIATLECFAHDLIEHVKEPPCEGCSFEGSCLGDVTQCDEWLGFMADAQRLGVA